jgi:hypothetical protein
MLTPDNAAITEIITIPLLVISSHASSARMEVAVRPHSLVRVHVHAIHEPSRLIRAKGQQTDSWDAVLLVDCAEVRFVRAVTSEINSAFRRIDQE